jgi:D-inositol-3-phosphate glycosyltransferase
VTDRLGERGAAPLRRAGGRSRGARQHVAPAAAGREAPRVLRVAMISLHTCPLAPPGAGSAGGMNVYVRELAAALGRRGATVDVFTRDHGCTLPPVKPVGPAARLVHVKAGPRGPLPKAAVADVAGEFAARVDRFAREAGPYDLVHAHYWLSGRAGLDLARRWGVPLVQMFHTLGHLKSRAAASEAERAGAARLRTETLLARVACRVVAATSGEREELVRSLRARAHRVSVVPAGVDLERFAPRDPAAAARRVGLAGTRSILYVGRLEPIKGVDRLVEAFARLGAGRDARLVVVGGDGAEGAPGGESRRLAALAARLGVGDRVEFRGPRPRQALPDYYAAAAAVVLPSAYESFNLVAVEALACGAALVATPVGVVPQVLEDGANGLVVPVGDVGALAAAIGRLLGDPPLAARLRRAARPSVEGYGWDAVAARIHALYDEVALPAEAAGVLV